MSDFGGVHRFNVTGLFHDMWGFPTTDPKFAYELLHHLVDKLENRADQIARYREYYTDDAEILLISYGSSVRSALHLVEERRKRGSRIGVLELQTLWPFPKALIRDQCKGRSLVVVVEMNMGQIYQEVLKVAPERERVYLANRFDGVFISPADILRVLMVLTGKGV
jgi:2-oxoglutarate ferredoxin oxidoreductase subunit alpha